MRAHVPAGAAYQIGAQGAFRPSRSHPHLPRRLSSPVGCAKLGQLLVWEWRSDSYVLKQQGHYHNITTTAFSPDGALVATGSDDRKVGLRADGAH